jgi:acylpyruvate hydrolase
MEKLELKLGVFRFPGKHCGKTGTVIEGDKVVDVNLAYAAYLAKEKSVEQPYQLANTVVPTDMISLINGGTATIQAIREAVAYCIKNDHWVGPNGENFVYDLNEVKTLLPVKPGKIICIGRSFMSHVQVGNLEAPEEPHIFMKPTSTAVATEEPVLLPKIWPDKVTYGTELTAVIGKKGKNFSKEEALDYVFGWTILNDVTCRGMLYPKNKMFDTFAPFGPYIVPADQIPDVQSVELKFKVDGEWKQEGNTKDMTWGIDYIIANVAEVMTLEPGDIIALGDIGAPETVSEGQVMEAIIPQIGVLRNPVIKEQ